MVTLVDSNVILDVLTDDPAWAAWSRQALAEAVDDGPVAVNPIIYAEVSVRFARIEDLEDAVPVDDFARLQLPWEAGFLAAKAFQRYRQAGGRRGATLPDFYIGAHAAVSGLRLLTRDRARYRTYFPSVDLIAPTPRP